MRPSSRPFVVGRQLAVKPTMPSNEANRNRTCIGREALLQHELDAVTAAHPRLDFKRRILNAFTEGVKHRPASTFGTVNADVPAHFDPGFVRADFVEIIRGNGWAE